MIDFFQNPFAPPAGRAASTDPFGQLRREDRWRLAGATVLGSNLGRRIFGLPDRKPDRKPDRNRRAGAAPADEAPNGAGAAWEFGAGYEAIPGWRVPLDADLKDLGRAALDNARHAEQRPDIAGQVRAAERERRTANAAQAGANAAAGGRTRQIPLRRGSAPVRPPAPQPLPGGRSATGTEGVFGIGRSAGAPKARPEIANDRQRQTEHPSRPPLTGLAAGLFPAHWRALAGGFLQAREAIKQASIAAERKHGDNRPAHDADVAAVARREDARLPGFTEHATVLSAQRAGGKYRQNMERRPAPTGGRNEAAHGRATVDGLAREAGHALGKAERALDAGDGRAAEGHKRDALLFLTNAKAAEKDAQDAGSAIAQDAAPDPGTDGTRNGRKGNTGGEDSTVAPAPDGMPAKVPAPVDKDSAGSRAPGRPADRERPATFGREDAMARLERQFVHGPGPLGATVNRRILAAATAAYANAEARDAAVRAAIRRAWRRDPAMQRKLTDAARAAAAGATGEERKRLFLEAAAGTTVERTLEALGKAENSRVSRINADRASAAFEAWRRANPEASEPERLNRAIDLALAYGAAPDALKTTVLRHISRKRGVRRDRHGKMTVADAGATWEIYAALGRLYRRDPEMATALFPGIHGFVAESVAGNRHGWNAAENDPAARAAILKRIYRDAEQRSLGKHEQGLHVLPVVGGLLAAPQTAKDADDAIRHAGEGRWIAAAGSALAAGAGLVFPAGRAAVKGAKGLRKKPATDDGGDKNPAADEAGDPAAVRRAEKDAPDPDGDFRAALPESESTGRFFREVERDDVWRARLAANVPTQGAEAYKGKPIRVGGGKPDVLVGEVRLHKEADRAYALNLRGERVYNTRMPSRTDPNISWESAGDGGWLVTKRLDNGRKFSVYYNPYGFPEFPARGAFWVSPEAIAKGGDAPKRYVKSQLKTMANSKAGRKKLKEMDFTVKQIEQMKQKVDLNELGIRLHHDYRVGRMQIVDRDLHEFAHQGGRSTW